MHATSTARDRIDDRRGGRHRAPGACGDGHLDRGKPLIYRTTVNNNDLDGVEGLGTPGRVVQLWDPAAQLQGTARPTARTCSRGARGKNDGAQTFITATGVGSNGVFRLTNLRARSTTVALFRRPRATTPASAGSTRSSG